MAQLFPLEEADSPTRKHFAQWFSLCLNFQLKEWLILIWPKVFSLVPCCSVVHQTCLASWGLCFPRGSEGLCLSMGSGTIRCCICCCVKPLYLQQGWELMGTVLSFRPASCSSQKSASTMAFSWAMSCGPQMPFPSCAVSIGQGNIRLHIFLCSGTALALR